MSNSPYAYVLELDYYRAAIRTAKATNQAVDYAELQKGLWTLAYNPVNHDAYFIKRFELSLIAAGYYEAFPLSTLLPLNSRSAIMTDLRENGWPELEGV